MELVRYCGLACLEKCIMESGGFEDQDVATSWPKLEAPELDYIEMLLSQTFA
jgi:hypothetical protein